MDDRPMFEITVRIDEWSHPNGTTLYLAHLEDDDGPCGMRNTKDETGDDDQDP